jgi:hypothetical protein
LPNLEDFVPEIASFIGGLILSAFGVPSVIDLGIMIIAKIQEVLPSAAGANALFAFHLLGWFLTFEVPLRILFFILGRSR